MKQTEQYQFNLLEGTDKLSPQPLNENMEKVETALHEAGQTLLKMVGSGGHTARIAFGQYVGNGIWTSLDAGGAGTGIEVDFKPVFVQVMPGMAKSTGVPHPSPFVRSATLANHDMLAGGSGYGVLKLTWSDHGVSWRHTGSSYEAEGQLNSEGVTYYWVAIGYDDSAEE